MKLLKSITFFMFVVLFMFSAIKSAEAAFAPWRPLCVGIQGKFVAKNWKGGPIEVGCVGDDGGATNQADQRCTGEVQVVEPNKEFRLTKCSCWGSNKGCLKVGKDLKLNPLNSNNRKTITIVKKIQDTVAFKNNGCTLNSTQIANYCAANGAKLLDKNIKITCDAPPTNTPTRKPSNTPIPTRNPSHTPTPTPRFTSTPTPTTPICVDPDRVTNVEVTCRNCKAQGSTDQQRGDIVWKVGGIYLSANNPYLQIGNSRIKIGSNPNINPEYAKIYQVGNTYRAELLGNWQEFSPIENDDVIMSMSIYFDHTPGGFWKISEISVSDGRKTSSFINLGPKTKTGADVQNSVGDYYIDNTGPTEFVSSDGNVTLHFENLQIGAFLEGVRVER